MSKNPRIKIVGNRAGATKFIPVAKKWYKALDKKRRERGLPVLSQKKYAQGVLIVIKCHDTVGEILLRVQRDTLLCTSYYHPAVTNMSDTVTTKWRGVALKRNADGLFDFKKIVAAHPRIDSMPLRYAKEMLVFLYGRKLGRSAYSLIFGTYTGLAGSEAVGETSSPVFTTVPVPCVKQGTSGAFYVLEFYPPPNSDYVSSFPIPYAVYEFDDYYLNQRLGAPYGSATPLLEGTLEPPTGGGYPLANGFGDTNASYSVFASPVIFEWGGDGADEIKTYSDFTVDDSQPDSPLDITVTHQTGIVSPPIAYRETYSAIEYTVTKTAYYSDGSTLDFYQQWYPVIEAETPQPMVLTAGLYDDPEYLVTTFDYYFKADMNGAPDPESPAPFLGPDGGSPPTSVTDYYAGSRASTETAILTTSLEVTHPDFPEASYQLEGSGSPALGTTGAYLPLERTIIEGYPRGGWYTYVDEDFNTYVSIGGEDHFMYQNSLGESGYKQGVYISPTTYKDGAQVSTPEIVGSGALPSFSYSADEPVAYNFNVNANMGLYGNSQNATYVNTSSALFTYYGLPSFRTGSLSHFSSWGAPGLTPESGETTLVSYYPSVTTPTVLGFSQALGKLYEEPTNTKIQNICGFVCVEEGGTHRIAVLLITSGYTVNETQELQATLMRALASGDSDAIAEARAAIRETYTVIYNDVCTQEVLDFYHPNYFLKFADVEYDYDEHIDYINEG